MIAFEQRCEKIVILGFRPGPTTTAFTVTEKDKET